MKSRILFPALLLALALAGCATTQADADLPPVDVTGAEVATRTEANGDVIEEYRVGSQLRMVKVTPARGPAYYLYDKNGDGSLEAEQKQMPATYWKLFSW
jgi:hypothetical protein